MDKHVDTRTLLKVIPWVWSLLLFVHRDKRRVKASHAALPSVRGTPLPLREPLKSLPVVIGGALPTRLRGVVNPAANGRACGRCSRSECSRPPHYSSHEH